MTTREAAPFRPARDTPGGRRLRRLRLPCRNLRLRRGLDPRLRRRRRSGLISIRTIIGPAAGVSECYAIALDNWHNELWVTTQSTVRVLVRRTRRPRSLRTITGFGFAAGRLPSMSKPTRSTSARSPASSRLSAYRNGNPAPLRTIQGNLTGLETVAALFVDRLNNELYSQNYGGAVVVFGRLDNGNVARARPAGDLPSPSAWSSTRTLTKCSWLPPGTMPRPRSPGQCTPPDQRVGDPADPHARTQPAAERRCCSPEISTTRRPRTTPSSAIHVRRTATVRPPST